MHSWSSDRSLAMCLSVLWLFLLRPSKHEAKHQLGIEDQVQSDVFVLWNEGRLFTGPNNSNNSLSLCIHTYCKIKDINLHRFTSVLLSNQIVFLRLAPAALVVLTQGFVDGTWARTYLISTYESTKALGTTKACRTSAGQST